MEKKTIGKFISALRRASGMTQKELGEKLYVSDKTVSRWERDECTPELSLLPAIAEIFGITTDELLRGERNSQTGEATSGQKNRSDKQFKVMLHNRMVRFRNLSMVSLAVALAAAIVAFVINESFYKGTLAFGIGAVLILAAFVCQFCFSSSSLLRLDDEDDTYNDEIRRANSKIITGTAGVLIAIISVFTFILPMGILGGSYYALSTGTALAQGCACVVIAVMVCHVVYVLWIRKLLVRREMIWEEGQAERKAEGRRKLLKRVLTVAVMVALVLLAALLVVMLLGPEVYAGQVDEFTDLEEFQTFMEDGTLKAWQDETIRHYGYDGLRGPGYVCIDIGNNGLYEEVIYAPEFDTAQITDEEGNVLCEYVSAPIFVTKVEWDVDEATGAVTVTARTLHGMEEAESIYLAVCTVLLLLVLANVLICTAVYLVRLGKKKYPA